MGESSSWVRMELNAQPVQQHKQQLATCNSYPRRAPCCASLRCLSKAPAVCSLVSHVLTMTHHVLNQEGDLQLWSLSTQKLIDSMPCADAVVSVAVMHSEPYVLLGCASGSVQVISLLSSSQDLAIGALEAQSMELQPYQGAKHTCFDTLPH